MPLLVNSQANCRVTLHGREEAVQVEAMTRMSKPCSLCVCFVLLHLVVVFVVVHGAIYDVGDGKWSFDMTSWPKGKTFRAGDVLVFKYEPAMHNVVVVDRRGYLTCTAPRNATVYQTGEDHIKLHRGGNYFICTFVGHCKYGMKIAVVAI